LSHPARIACTKEDREYNATKLKRPASEYIATREEKFMTTTRLAMPTLAQEYLRGEGAWMEAARVASANLLMVLCAWIAMPLPGTPVPLTGQTFGALLVGALFGATCGWQAMMLYLLEGAAGLPVFQPFGAQGAAHFSGPTTGYLLAFPAAAALTGWLVARGKRHTVNLLGALLAGEGIIFTSGCVWLAFLLHLGWRGTLLAGLTPFVLGEIIKMAAVMAAVGGLELGRRSSR
jgi:biotin transport system substrate-specific component